MKPTDFIEIKPKFVFVLIVFCSVFFFSCSEASNSSTNPNTDQPVVNNNMATIAITSTNFTDGGTIPANMYGDNPNLTAQNGARNISPQLSLTETNSNVKSHLILMYDTTATGGFFHWFRANVTGNEIDGGVGSTHSANNGITTHTFARADSTFEQTNQRYLGPQPPPTDTTHTYVTMVFGIDEASISLGGATFGDHQPLYTSLLAIHNASTPRQLTSITHNGVAFKVLSYGAISGTARHQPVVNNNMATIAITSTNFTDGGTIPANMYGDNPNLTAQNGARNISPQLSLTETNSNVKSHLILMYDTTATGGFFHWFRANVAGNGIDGGVGSAYSVNNGITSHVQVTSEGIFLQTNRQYYGPQPPPTSTTAHTYVTMVFGIDEASISLGGATFDDHQPLYTSLLAIHNATVPRQLTSITHNGVAFKVLSYGAISGRAGYLR